MSDILVLNKHSLIDTLVATSLIGRLVDDGHRVHCMTDGNSVELFKYCGCRTTGFFQPSCSYDRAINLSPSLLCTEIVEKVRAKDKDGFGQKNGVLHFFNEGADLLYRARVVGIPTDANLFQLVFGAAQTTWQGEGYRVGYFPKHKTKRNAVGIAMRDRRLEVFVRERLKLDRERFWYIPFKHNPLKQIDEVNRCRDIITDDEGVVHAALALRKHAEFIVRKPTVYKLEMFGSGNIHVIDPH